MQRHIGFYYIVSILFLLLLPACVQEELQQVPGKGEGILRLGITSDLSGLSSKQTKTTIDLDLPEEITIEITGDEGVQTETITMSDHSVNTGITLKTGTYTVKAYAGTNNLVQENPYFESESKSVTIQPLQSTDVILTATVKNAWIVPNVDEDLKRHYTNWAVNLTVDGNQHQLISNETESNGLFVQAGKSVELTFDGTNVLGEKKSTSLSTIETVAAKKYVINCNPDVPQFSMGLTATATHTNDGSGNLNGTNVTFNVETFEGLASLVQSWKVEVAYNETVIRTYENNSAPVVGNSYTMNVVEGWPYVPQGSTLSASLTLKTGEVITPTIISFDLPAPSFGVTVSAETSYSRYLNYKNDVSGYTLALANTSGTGDKVMDLWTQVKISDVILNNSKYTSLIGNMAFTYDGLSLVASGLKPTSAKIVPTTLQNNEGLLEGDDIINQAWGSHTVAASFTFDGVNQSPSIPCHVTGLPYLIQEMGKSRDYGWNWSNTSFTQKDRASMTHGDNTYGLSPKFYVPENSSYDVKVYLWACYYNLWTYDPYLYISVSDLVEKGKNFIHIEKKTSDPAAGLNECNEYNIDLNFNNTASSLCLYEYSSKGNKTCAIFVAKCQILYR